MKSYYPAPRTSGLDLQVVGSCGVFCLHQSALWLIRTETKISMSNSHFSQRTFPTHTAEDRTDQKLYRHQCQPNCTKESLATDHGGNPATYNPSEVAAFHRSLLLSERNSKPKKKKLHHQKCRTTKDHRGNHSPKKRGSKYAYQG